MKPGARERAGDPSRSQRWAKSPQPPYEVADQLRKPIDGLAHLDERIRAFVVESLSPGRHGERRDEESPSGFRLRPAPRGAQRQNRKSIDRLIVRPTLGRESFHPSILDARLLETKIELTLQADYFRLGPDSRVGVVRGAGHSVGECDCRHRGGVDDGRADATGPMSGQGNPPIARGRLHEKPPRSPVPTVVLG